MEKEVVQGLHPKIFSCLVQTAALALIFSEACCIRDAVILGCFTVSRCGECCSSKCHKGEEFGKVPNTLLTAAYTSWQPIGFCSSDMVFLDKDLHVIPWPAASAAASLVRIYFRYNKGDGCNFSERTFHRVTSQDPFLSFLCPVATCLWVLARWSAISADRLIPVFNFQLTSKSKCRFLADIKVTATLCSTIITTYPDSSHLYHIKPCLRLSCPGCCWFRGSWDWTQTVMGVEGVDGLGPGESLNCFYLDGRCFSCSFCHGVYSHWDCSTSVTRWGYGWWQLALPSSIDPILGFSSLLSFFVFCGWASASSGSLSLGVSSFSPFGCLWRPPLWGLGLFRIIRTQRSDLSFLYVLLFTPIHQYKRFLQPPTQQQHRRRSRATRKSVDIHLAFR